jgi:hypothetical protein
MRAAVSPDRVLDPTPFEIADLHLRMASEACGRGALRDALASVGRARLALETEQQFRDARKARA